MGAFIAASNLAMESLRLVVMQYLLVGCDMHPLQVGRGRWGGGQGGGPGRQDCW